MQIVVSIIIFLILDALWLGVLAKNLYANNIGPLLRLNGGKLDPIWLAAVVVYIALLLGIHVFVLPKAQGHGVMALLWGGLFGLITYAIYDFTNLAVLSGWSLKVTLIDCVWGMILCGLTSYLTVVLTK